MRISWSYIHLIVHERWRRDCFSSAFWRDTSRRVSVCLQRLHPSEQGFSARSVRRYCSEENIHYRSGLSDCQLDKLVADRVQAVGHSYGRRTMHGLLRAQGIHVSQRRLSRYVSRVAPGPQPGRTHGSTSPSEPSPIHCSFFRLQIISRSERQVSNVWSHTCYSH